MKRRNALMTLTALVPAACSSISGTGGTGTTTVTVTLAAVQAQASAIMSALNAEAPALIATLATAVRTKATTALQSANAAVTTLLNIPADTTGYKPYVQAALQAIAGVVSLIPLPPTTQMGIQAGLILLAALVNSVGTVTVTTPSVTPSTKFAAPERGQPQAPIYIPIS